MRELLVEEAPVFVALATMCLVATSLALAVGSPSQEATAPFLPLPGPIVSLPGPEDDQDLDGYSDAVDLWEGDLVLRLELTRLVVSGAARPYVVVGTQDDQWRTGEGAELEWRHVVDYDGLGHDVGSPDWQRYALRTGAWWISEPADDHRRSIAHASALEPGDGGDDVRWPQTFMVNVRDDRDKVRLDLRVLDADPDPDRSRASWHITVDVASGAWEVDGERYTGNTTLHYGGVELQMALSRESGLDMMQKQLIAKRWAPTLFFDSEEEFYPTRGKNLEAFHGFASRNGDHRTWTPSFNNGRHGYQLLRADFDGDRVVDHEDVVILTDILRAGDPRSDTIYAHVQQTTGGTVVVQYWFLYMFNFVLDESGRTVQALEHAGDREFIQLRFHDLAAAHNGTPSSIAYSQHYRGIRIDDPAPGEPPLHGSSPAVYVARGSHASFPVDGTTQSLRRAFAGYFDTFDGGGEVWTPEDYELEVLGTEPWHGGYLWGPVTREARDLGTATKPLLQHHFRYPYTDPVYWQHPLATLAPNELGDLYGSGVDR